MQDVKLTPDSLGVFDLSIDDKQLAFVDGLQTAIEVSLFTDARAPDSLVPEASRRRGWVGNIITSVQGREIGSLVWLLDQARLTTSTMSSAKIYAKDATLHFIEDGVAREINTSVIKGTRSVEIQIEIIISDNLVERYNVLWRNTNAAGISNI